MSRERLGLSRIKSTLLRSVAQTTHVDEASRTLTPGIIGGSGTLERVSFDHVSPGWGAKPRPPPWNAIPEEVEQKVRGWVEKETWTSPCAKHIIRLWKRCKVYDRHPIHFYYGTKKELFAKFCAECPDIKISLASFKRPIPWFVRKGGRESCLCGCCQNMRLLLKALNDAQPLLCEALEHSADASGDPCCTSSPEGTSDRTGGTRESADAEGTHCKLCEVASETSKSKLMEKLLCDNAETQGKHACVDGSCESCGFARLWSKGLRPLIVDDTTITEKNKKDRIVSRLKSDSHANWNKPVKWSEHKAEREVGNKRTVLRRTKP